MPDLMTVTLTFAVVGFIMALGIWVLLGAKTGTDRAKSAQNIRVGEASFQRGNMQTNDWFNAAINLFMGVALGMVIGDLGLELTTDFWPIAILTSILFAGFLLFDEFLSRVIDRVFPSGIRSARKPPTKRRTPLPRLLSLPAGIIIGVALAWLGLVTFFWR